MRTLVVDAGLLWRFVFAAATSNETFDPGAKFLSSLLSWSRYHGTRGLHLAWEGGKDGRRVIWPEYKSKPNDDRTEEISDAYDSALRTLDFGLALVGAHRYRVEGWEADDVCATLARTLRSKVLIATQDKDLLQVVDDRVHLLRLTRGPNGSEEQVVTPHSWEKVAKIKPTPNRRSAWIAYQALVGDTSDGYKGVPGVGEKGARRALTVYPDLLSRIGRPDALVDLDTRTRNVLSKPESLTAASLSWKLAELRCDLDVEPLPGPERDLAVAASYFESKGEEWAEAAKGPLRRLRVR